MNAGQSSRDDLDERKVISNKIEEQELNLSKARKRLLKEETDADDFKAIKAECKEELKQYRKQTGRSSG